MSLVLDVGPELEASEHKQDESTSKTKKRPQSNEVSELPSAKRLKASEDVAQSSKKPKTPKSTGKARVSAARSKTTRSLQFSGKPAWSMVASSDVFQALPDLAPVDIRPRLWSTTREELGSTFVEISGSKCVNNVSWTLTDMPILVLDDGSMSLQKPKDGNNELCMDLIFIREFVCAAPSALREDKDLSATTPVVDVQPERTLSQVNVSQASVDPIPASDLQEPQPLAPEISGGPPPDGASPSESTITQHPITASNPVTAPKLKPKSKRAPKKAQLKQPKAPETPVVEPVEPPPRPVSRVLRNPRRTGAAAGALSSLRFKKIKLPSPKPPPTPETSQNSPDIPQPSPLASSLIPDGNVPRPLEQNSLQNLHPNQQSLQRLTPDTPMSELETIIQTQSNLEPAFRRYPDNRLLPNSTRFPPACAEKHHVPLSAPPIHHPVEFKIDLGEFRMLGKTEVDPGGRMMTRSAAAASVVTAKDREIFQAHSITECQCSRLRYDPKCRVCGDGVSTGDLTPPIATSSLQPSVTGEPEKKVLMDVETVQLSDPEATHPEATYPNTIPLVWAKVWRGQTHIETVHRNRPLMVASQSTCTNHQPWGPPSFPVDDLPSTIPEGDESLRLVLPSAPPQVAHTVQMTPVSTMNAAQAPSNNRIIVPPVANICHSSHAQSVAPRAIIPIWPIQTRTSPIPSSNTPTLPRPTQITKMPTSEHSPPAPPDQPVIMNDTTISPSLKRKGKEKARTPESSDDDEPLAIRSKRVRQSKKAKLSHDPAINGYNFFSAQTYETTMPIACSSKTRLEDLPVWRPDIPQVPAQNRVRVPDGDGSTVEELPPPSISTVTKPLRRRGRPQKAPKAALDASLSTAQPLLTEFSSNEAQPQPTSLSTKPRSRSKPKAKPTPPAPIAPVQWRDNGVPLPIPDEIQALADAYINGIPIGVFASKSHMQGFWQLKLVQEEIGYAFMGFYRVSRVMESLEGDGVHEGENGKDEKETLVLENRPSKARVCWRFKLIWEPGGEGWQIRDRRKLTSPWWNSKLKAQELSILPRADLEDSDDESTLTYRLARRANPNFARRHCYLDQAFSSVLPLHLLAPINAEIPDTALPRGWHCEDCGKLNFRYYLRHRRCSSSYCQDKPEAEGYIVDIDRLRDPQDRLPLTLPLNELPGHVRIDFKVQIWNDRMKTLVYRFETEPVEGPAVVQHIFTCNLADLQAVPSELLNSIQMDVPLRRSTGETNPYFMCSVCDASGKAEGFPSWETAPRCLQDAKELMNSRGRKYGRKTAIELDITKLEIRAWVTAGSKRSSDLLRARQRCVVIMCLGCEVIISIAPKSAIVPSDHQTRMPDLDKLIPMESFDPQEDQMTKPELGDSVKLESGMTEDNGDKGHIVSAPSMTRRGTRVKSQRSERAEMTLSLVHGDILVLEGDDFEYSIKRTGTTILLFGS